jgi:hypothetical protein
MGTTELANLLQKGELGLRQFSSRVRIYRPITQIQSAAGPDPGSAAPFMPVSSLVPSPTTDADWYAWLSL